VLGEGVDRWKVLGGVWGGGGRVGGVGGEEREKEIEGRGGDVENVRGS